MSRLSEGEASRLDAALVELYNELYRQLGTEAQLSITLSTANREVVAFALNREGSGFSERDRELLDRLAPHLTVSRENARRLSSATAESAIGDGAAHPVSLEHVTDRQRQVHELVAEGLTNVEIANILGISPATAKKHLEHISERLGVFTRTAAAALYLRALRPGSPRQESSNGD